MSDANITAVPGVPVTDEMVRKFWRAENEYTDSLSDVDPFDALERTRFAISAALSSSSLREVIAAEVLAPVRELLVEADEWRTLDSMDAGIVYAAEKVDDWLDDIRAALSAPVQAAEEDS